MKLVVTENISANGVIEFLDPWFDPGEQTDTDDLLEVMRDHQRLLAAARGQYGQALLAEQQREEFRCVHVIIHHQYRVHAAMRRTEAPTQPIGAQRDRPGGRPVISRVAE